MSRVNDVGGQQGFGAVDPDVDEAPVFHADWEARVFALQRVLLARGAYNLDEFRDAVERMPPQDYLTSSYYERWLAGIETLLAEKGLLDRE
ncbi:nitrile hydratase subunit beta [Saccharopolyspora sp. TS4A08]|uniref:Nitrile hydratase subunit beta n=1 Tax=Saccharopolyspora ipomoeae TaxID=3042027 RepID=A0ABT6PWC7_9PSEU|nr:SH3-like domain-containing protein [Saccharopolyspora sp. TS4A08]MDI2032307.1 nitrile hydratase subunit beta [Saccharopolyspora sp. TS4A08]